MTVLSHAQDPWASRTSVHGYAMDELISALQKYVRRGVLEEAILVARELWESDTDSNSDCEEKLWERLKVMAVEEIGLSDRTIMMESWLMNELRMSLPRRSRDRWLMTVQVVRRLSETPKDRSTDDLAAWAVLMSQTRERVPVIPEFALDVHTRRGQEAGRDSLHFLRSSTLVSPESPQYDDKYWRLLVAAAERGDWND